MGITARKRHTFRVNKSFESRIIALALNILEGLGGVGVRARGAGHAPARACARGWAVCPHSLDLETRRQASLARDRARVP